MNCSFCQSETPEFTEEDGGKNAFCGLDCQKGYYDQIGVVVYNPVTKQWMPKDLIIKQLIKLNFKDLIQEYKAFPELKEILDSKEFEIQWLHSFSSITKEDIKNGEDFCVMMDYSYEKKFRIGLILFDISIINDFILTSELIEYALQFKIFKPKPKYGEWAIVYNKLRTFELLLANGMIDFPPEVYHTSLMMRAMEKNRLDFLRLMLMLPSKRFDPSYRENLLIHIAAQDNHVDALRLLLNDKRVDPVSDNNFPIRVSIQNGHVDIVRLLLNDPRVDPTANDYSAIQTCVTRGHENIFKLLLTDNRFDPSFNNNVVIRMAAKIGRVEIVKLLLADPRVNPAANNNSPIRFASEKGHLETVKLLLSDPRVDPTANDNYAIQFASTDGHLEVVKLLLSDPRVDPSSDDNLAIRSAAENNHLAIVKLLLSVENLYNAKVHLQLMIIAKERNNKELSDLVQGFARQMNEGDRKKVKILNKI